ncbi:MAG: IMP dehydrogenase [bacterium]
MNDIKFDLNDILIKPAITTDINSRYSISLPTPLPLITAPMDSVVNLNNHKKFIDNGIGVALPRTISYEEYYDRKIYSTKKGQYTNNTYARKTFISLGFSDLDRLLSRNPIILLEIENILIDVANGHMKKIIEYCKKLKKINKNINIMVGNIANPETYEYYTKEGCVDYIRVGIGSGGGCLTSKHATIGHPMGSLIHETYQIKKKLSTKPYHLPHIVADGGMKDYSDIIKAYALGADYVMIGSLFNKAIESAGDNYCFKIKINPSLANFLYKKGLPIKKMFRGMSTKEAQKAMGKTSLKTSEGVVRYRDVEYTLTGWMENFNHYLRSAMSYCNAHDLEQFIGGCDFIRISDNSYKRFDK